MSNPKLPIIIFFSTVTLGLLSVFLSWQFQNFGRIAEVFYEGGPYESESPQPSYGSGPGGSACSRNENCSSGLSCINGHCQKDPGTCPGGTIGNNCHDPCYPGDGCDSCNCPPPNTGQTCGCYGNPYCSNPVCPCIDTDPSTQCVGSSPQPSPSVSQQPSPSPAVSPKSSPSVLPSSSPSPGNLSCLGLTANASLENVKIGNTLIFSCSYHSSSTQLFNHFDYRIHRPSDSYRDANYWFYPTNWQKITGNTSPFIVQEAGNYIVQCRACSDSRNQHCTSWGNAGGWTN